MFKIVPRILLIFGLFISVVLLGFYLSFKPSYLSQVLNGQEKVLIERDHYGIPTIHAPTKEGFFYGLGTALAEDRIFQISFRRLVYQGRLAEHLGPRALEMDRFHREINLGHYASRLTTRLRNQFPQHYAQLDAFVRGINDRVLKMHWLPMDFWFIGLKWQHWTVDHIAGILKLQEFAISMNFLEQCTRSVLLANYTKEEVDKMLPKSKEDWAFDSIPIAQDSDIPERLKSKDIKNHLEMASFEPILLEPVLNLSIFEMSAFDATNSWAVSGNYTESGRPLLVNDPHLQSILPCHWYQYKGTYSSKGKNVSLIGMQNAGAPFFWGKNQYFGMAVSITYGDNQDLYRETIHGNQYLVDETMKNLTIRHEKILIKENGGLREENYTVRETHRGPIIKYIFHALGSYKLNNEESLSLAWSGHNDDPGMIAASLDLQDAYDLDSLNYVLRNATTSSIFTNFIFATKDDHIIMQQMGNHPIRRNPDTGNYVKDGTTSKNDWIGIIPPYDRVHFMDPERGFIVNANNKIAPDNYYNGQFSFTSYTARMDRITYLLSSKIKNGQKIGVKYAKQLFLDTIDHYCLQILPEILAVVEEAKQLQNFTCDFTNSSTQASMYEIFMYKIHVLTKKIETDRAGIYTFASTQQSLYNRIHKAFKGDSTQKQILLKAWREAMTYLANHFKTEDRTQWRWGVIHPDIAHHIPFTSSPLRYFYDRNLEGRGNAHTINLAKMHKSEFGNFEVNKRANARIIFSFSEDEDDWWMLDGGSSENVLSGHYDDQWNLFKNDQIFKTGLPTRPSTTRGREKTEDL